MGEAEQGLCSSWHVHLARADVVLPSGDTSITFQNKNRGSCCGATGSSIDSGLGALGCGFGPWPGVVGLVSLQFWLSLWLWLESDLWPGSSTCHRVATKINKYNKNNREFPGGSRVEDLHCHCAVAQGQSLAWEFLHAVGESKK